jgi:hypothetical protein
MSFGSFVGLGHRAHRWRLGVDHVQNMPIGSTGVKSHWGIRALKPAPHAGAAARKQAVRGLNLAMASFP